MSLPDGVSLPDAITAALPPDDRMRIGQIISLSPVTVEVQGAPIQASPVVSLNLNVGDNVVVMRQDATWAIFGKTGDPAAGLFATYQAGYFSISPAASTTFLTSTISFTIPFRAPPAMSANLNMAPGPTSGWIIKAINITATDFQLFASGTASTFTVDASWIAMERTS